MTISKPETGQKTPGEANTQATKTTSSPHSGKSAAHSRSNTPAARPDRTKPARPKRRRVSRAALIELDMNRWLVVADERDPAGTAKLAMAALASTGFFFLMAGEVVEWTPSGRSGIGGLKVLGSEDIAAALAELTYSVGFERTTGRLQHGPSPAQLAKLIQVHRPYAELPVLRGVVVGPAKRSDGTMITELGYDKLSGLLVVYLNANPAHFKPPVVTGDAELDELLASLG